MPFDGIRDGYTVAMEALARGMMPPDRLSVWQFADRHIHLPRGTTNRHFAGLYQTARTPMAREVMECLSPHHPARRVVAMMASQLIKTQIGLNFLLFYTKHDPQTQLAVWPTEDLAERNSKTKYTPISEASPDIRACFVASKSRDSGNTILDKTFDGGSIQFAGANSPSSLSSRGGAILWCDEVDRYPHSAGVEGDPVSIARRALIAYQDCAKEYISSTPTIKSLSRIHKEFKLSDQRYYHVPCPHCGELQKLEWANFRWDEGKPETAHFVCVHNGCIIKEHDKVTMLPDEHMGGRARWIAENPDSKVPGFHAWAAYSALNMGMSWMDLAAEWETCKGDPEKEKVYINIYRAECFDDPGEKLDWEVIKQRVEDYALRSIPAGCMMLTAGVDVQGNRLALQLVGWGENGQVWPGIDWVELPGDPTRPDVWNALDKLLETPLTNRWGVSIKISATAIDSGYLPDEVYKFVRPRQHRNIFAVKGSSIVGKTAISTATPQDRNAKGKQLKRGAKSWSIGTDGIKATIFMWLNEDGKHVHAIDRRVHFSRDLPDEYFAQLCAEIYDPHKHKWVKQQARNEALDTLVYAIAAARHPKLRIHLMRDVDWTRFAAVMQPATGDLFAQQTAPEQPAKPIDPTPLSPGRTRPRMVPRKSGFAQNWKR